MAHGRPRRDDAQQKITEMKLTAELNGELHHINFRREETQVIALIDGRRYEVSARAVEKDAYLLMNSGRVYECRVESKQPRQNSLVVHVGNDAYPVTLADPKRLSSVAASKAGAGDGSAQIIAPMPGKVVRILVEKGAEVEAGDSILVVEAMKMQNEMKSPRTGTVTEIRAAEGDTVNAGDVLAIIE